MVEHGWALAYRSYSFAFVPQEAYASTHNLGIWQREFENPWDWRKNKDTNKNLTKVTSCQISNKNYL